MYNVYAVNKLHMFLENLVQYNWIKGHCFINNRAFNLYAWYTILVDLKADRFTLMLKQMSVDVADLLEWDIVSG